VSWKEALSYCQQEIGARATSRFSATGCIGQFVDQSSVLLVKELLNSLGSCDLRLPPSAPRGIDVDMRDKYLLAFEASQTRPPFREDPCDMVLLVNANPRYEGSLLNVLMRQLVLGSKRAARQFRVATIGSPMDLTYPTDHLGNSGKTPYQMAQGKHIGVLQLLKSHRPRYILG
jgi:hypothetical protein